MCSRKVRALCSKEKRPMENHAVLKVSSLIEARDLLHWRPQEVECEAGKVAYDAPAISIAAVSRGARDRTRPEHYDPPAAEPAHDVDILHQRQRLIAADLVKESCRDEETLISVRQLQQSAPQRHASLDYSRCKPRVIERKPEGCRRW